MGTRIYSAPLIDGKGVVRHDLAGPGRQCYADIVRPPVSLQAVRDTADGGTNFHSAAPSSGSKGPPHGVQPLCTPCPQAGSRRRASYEEGTPDRAKCEHKIGLKSALELASASAPRRPLGLRAGRVL